jgi:hypothetical protein
MSKTVYIVQRIGWEYDDNFFYPVYTEPVKAFVARESAEAQRKILERQAREEWFDASRIPPEFDDRHNGEDWNKHYTKLTALTFSDFCERLKLLGVEPPTDENDFSSYAFWGGIAKLPSETYHAVYDLLDGLNFYEIIALEVTQ